jgi:hypothetical protein
MINPNRQSSMGEEENLKQRNKLTKQKKENKKQKSLEQASIQWLQQQAWCG